ncbi:uncharacterized protein TNCV_247631 [Trichonephila clavipes]|nr:uncharacterized protein TNCV_247631 [Trichonephila clavipes]
MSSRIVFCIDTSGSTYGNFKYYKSVNKLVSQHKEKTIISWNSSAHIVDSRYFFNHEIAFGNTNFDECLKLLTSIKFQNIYLIVTTDGIVWNEDYCRELMKKTSLLKHIKFVELHFIGDEEDMNLKIITVFEGIPQKLFINNENVASVKSTFSIDDLNLQDLPSLKATIISKSKSLQPTELYKILQEWENKAINEITKEVTEFFKEPLKKFYDMKNCKDCAKLIKTEYISLQNIKAINPDTVIEPTEYSDEEEGGLFHHDIINEVLLSSGISETSISLGYHLGKRARNSRHSTKSHSSSSGDSRRRLVKHKSRHSKCSNREVEAKETKVSIFSKKHLFRSKQ